MRTSIYKPSENMKVGCAFQFSVGTKRKSKIPVLFIEAVKQSKPKPPPGSAESPFNWKDDKVTMMLNPDELGTVACFIDGFNIGKPSVEFIHKSELNGKEKTSTFKLSPPITDEQKKFGNWALSISLQSAEGNKSVSGYIPPSTVYRIKHLADHILSIYNDLEERDNDAGERSFD